MVDAIVWILRTGAPWADLPSRYPPYQTCHRWFQTWSATGKMKKLLTILTRNLSNCRRLGCTCAGDRGSDARWQGSRRASRPIAARCQLGHAPASMPSAKRGTAPPAEPTARGISPQARVDSRRQKRPVSTELRNAQPLSALPLSMWLSAVPAAREQFTTGRSLLLRVVGMLVKLTRAHS